MIAGAAMVVVPHVLFAQQAQEFVPLVGVPGVSDNAQDTQSYISALYVLAIAIAVLIAVIKIIWAGVQYMFSEIVTSKENAKREIRSAFLGLIIILGAVILLETINPNLTRFDFLRNAEPVTVTIERSSTGQLWNREVAGDGAAEAAACEQSGGRAQRLPVLGGAFGGQTGTRVICHAGGTTTNNPSTPSAHWSRTVHTQEDVSMWTTRCQNDLNGRIGIMDLGSMGQRVTCYR